MFEWLYKKIPAKIVLLVYKRIFSRKDINTFEKFLEIDKWEKVNHNPEKWIFKEDNSFVIEVGLESDDFEEEWTQIFPDKRAFVKEVYLKINNERIIKPLRFVSLDGGRYFVPLPKIDTAYNERYFYWDKDSIDYKVFKIIGFLYREEENFDDLAKRCGILIK